MARFVGITFRRAGLREAALESLASASSMAAAEWSAAEQEKALTLWARGDARGRAQAHRIVRAVNGFTGGPRRLGLGPDHGAPFGELSMTVSRLHEEPWRAARLPRLFSAYRQAIDSDETAGADSAAIALHRSLLDYQRGRLRAQLAGGRRWPFNRVNRWVLAPFRQARQWVNGADDRSLHARFDVMAGLAVAESVFGECKPAMTEVAELDRLAELLSDPDRRTYWRQQRARIVMRCRDASETAG